MRLMYNEFHITTTHSTLILVLANLISHCFRSFCCRTINWSYVFLAEYLPYTYALAMATVPLARFGPDSL